MSSCLFLNMVTVSNTIAAYKRMNYPLFEKGNFNLNIFAIRANEQSANTFNDLIGILYKENDTWVLKRYAATTDPGLYYRENPINIEGTAILQDGYHKSAFRIGKHQGKYEALVQNRTLPLWRDNNKDDILDRMGETHNDLAGINIHRATAIKNGVSKQVDKWSAGCQVIASNSDFNEFMFIVNQSAKIYGKTFSYALFTEQQFFQ